MFQRHGAFVYDRIPDQKVDRMLGEAGLKLEPEAQPTHPPWQLECDPSAHEFMGPTEPLPPPPQAHEHVVQHDELVVRPPHLGAPTTALPPIS